MRINKAPLLCTILLSAQRSDNGHTGGPSCSSRQVVLVWSKGINTGWHRKWYATYVCSVYWHCCQNLIIPFDIREHQKIAANLQLGQEAQQASLGKYVELISAIIGKDKGASTTPFSKIWWSQIKEKSWCICKALLQCTLPYLVQCLGHKCLKYHGIVSA